MDDAVAGQLSWIVASYGRDVCGDPRRVEALLRDLSGESRREVAVLSGAAREGIPAELMRSAGTVPAAMLAEQLAKKLEDHLGLSEGAAQWAVAAWGSALGVDGFVLEGSAAERQPGPSGAVLRPLPPQAAGSLTPARTPGIRARPRLIHALTGHTEAVTGVAFSPDGTLLATASYDKTARLWDTATGKTIRTLTGHHRRKGQLHQVAFSPDGALLATASADKTARLWDAATGQTIRTLTGHTNSVYDVAFSPDGTLLATASSDNTARLWDTATGQNIDTLIGHTEHVAGMAFSPDGTLLATASGDYTARLWDTATGQTTRTLAGHAHTPKDVGGEAFQVTDVAFSPDGILLATAGFDGTVRLWDTITGQNLRTLAGHPGRVFKVVFSPDGAFLATDSTDRTVRLWSLG